MLAEALPRQPGICPYSVLYEDSRVKTIMRYAARTLLDTTDVFSPLPVSTLPIEEQRKGYLQFHSWRGYRAHLVNERSPVLYDGGL